MKTSILIAVLLIAGAHCYSYDTYSNLWTVTNGSQSIKLGTKQINSTHFKVYGEVTAATIGNDACFIATWNAPSGNNWTTSTDAFLINANRVAGSLSLADGLGAGSSSSNNYYHYIFTEPANNDWRFMSSYINVLDPSFQITTTADSATFKFEIFRNYTAPGTNDVMVWAPYQMMTTSVGVSLWNTSCPGPNVLTWMNATRHSLANGFTYDALKPTLGSRAAIAAFALALFGGYLLAL